MDELSYKGKLKWYMAAPILVTPLFLLGNIYVYLYDLEAGLIMTGVIVLYVLVMLLFFLRFRRRMGEAIVDFAVRYGTVQKELLDKFQIPYALLDSNGRFLWMNQQFSTVTGLEKHYRKSVESVFPTVTTDMIRNEEENQIINIEFGEQKFAIHMQRIGFENEESENELIGFEHESNHMTALLLFDITELEEVRQENVDLKLVPAIIYIDNYDEIVDKVEIVKKSMLTAVIDRKITAYFQAMDGIVEKIEKDKYFVAFQYRYLKKLEENRFSLLEEVKSIHMGNDSDVTLSIGVGVGAQTYTESLEFASAAINIALGRGGSQAVIKDGKSVSYYGIHGKEVEKNTRVKARVKAQALREVMETKENVLVMGHAISDIDAFGAAVGVAVAARELGKKSQIILNTITTSLRPLVDAVMNQEDTPEDFIINSEEAMRVVNDRTMVMVVDTNRANYTECPEILRRTENIVVFDHHRQGDGLILNPILSYIEPYASSTCEMVAEVLQYFSERIQIRPLEADCIYAGMLIDTNNFMAKTGVRTFEAAAYLRRNGADMTRVRKMLRENMQAYKARAEVVRNAEVYRDAFAISVCDSSDLESPTVVGAQAANELLDITGIKASFVLTDFQKKIYISARSIDEIDVQMIMERMGGGGHLNFAGAQIEGKTIEEVTAEIRELLDRLIEEGEIVL